MALSEADLVAAGAGRDGPRRTKVIRPVAFSIRDLWAGLMGLSAYAALLVVLRAHRLKIRYKQSMLGIAWAVIQPVARVLIYALAFSVFTRIATPRVAYAVFASAALLPCTFFSTSLTNA